MRRHFGQTPEGGGTVMGSSRWSISTGVIYGVQTKVFGLHPTDENVQLFDSLQSLSWVQVCVQ